MCGELGGARVSDAKRKHRGLGYGLLRPRAGQCLGESFGSFTASNCLRVASSVAGVTPRGQSLCFTQLPYKPTKEGRNVYRKPPLSSVGIVW